MNELKYTITKFDAEQKLIDVVFADGNWAQIRLVVPLPKNVAELENIIKQFAAPVEALEAQASPDSDLSYIVPLVGNERTCERNRLTQANAGEPTLDPELDALLAAQEQAAFESRVKDVLNKLGLVAQ